MSGNLTKDKTKWEKNMRVEIPTLETIKSLEFAKELNELKEDDQFTICANMKWVRPFGMLLAVCSLRQFHDKHFDRFFTFESDGRSEGVPYAAHMGFFKAISDKIHFGKEPGEAKGNNNYIPITELDFHQFHREKIQSGRMIEMGEAIEIKASELAKILSRDNKEMHVLITYLIREILRNIPEHADCEKAWVCGQYWSTDIAEIAIVDEGIGIKNSLRRNSVHRKYIETDEDAITSAIKAGISQAFQPSKANPSRDIWANSGFGLYMVSEICKKLQGSFCLASGEKYIYLKSNGVRLGNTSFKGTAVKITISTKNLRYSQEIITNIAKQGQEQAKTVRNAFKTASIPSKGLMDNI